MNIKKNAIIFTVAIIVLLVFVLDISAILLVKNNRIEVSEKAKDDMAAPQEIQLLQEELLKKNIAIDSIFLTAEEAKNIMPRNKADQYDVETLKYFRNILTGGMSYFAKDKNNIYIFNSWGYLFKIPGADTSTFKIAYKGSYGVDKDNFFGSNEYFIMPLFKNVDEESFVFLNDNYIKDKNGAYFIPGQSENAQKIIAADIESFNALSLESCDKEAVDSKGANILFGGIIYCNSGDNNSRFAKDKKSVYYKGQKLVGFNPGTFQVVSAQREDPNDYGENMVYYIKDAKQVWYIFDPGRDKAITKVKLYGADPVSFTAIGSRCYAADKTHVYFKEKIIKGMSPDGAYVFDSCKYSFGDCPYYIKNKTNVYFEGNLLSKADPDSFTCSRYFIPYAKDKENVYFKFGLVKGADAKNFRASAPNTVYHACGYDSKNYFYEGVLETAKQKVCEPDFSVTGDSLSQYYPVNFNYAFRTGTINMKALPGDCWPFFNMKTDDNYVYQIGTGDIQVGADTSTFQLVTTTQNNYSISPKYACYFKDKNSVYYYNRLMPGVDPVSFTAFIDFGNDCAHDKNSIYCKGVVLPESDYTTLEKAFCFDYGSHTEGFLHCVYKDKNNVYFVKFIAKNLQVAEVAKGFEGTSFKSYCGSYQRQDLPCGSAYDDGYYVTDNNKVYYFQQEGFKEIGIVKDNFKVEVTDPEKGSAEYCLRNGDNYYDFGELIDKNKLYNYYEFFYETDEDQANEFTEEVKHPCLSI